MPRTVATLFPGFGSEAHEVSCCFEPGRVRKRIFSTVFLLEGFYVEDEGRFAFEVGGVYLFKGEIISFTKNGT